MQFLAMTLSGAVSGAVYALLAIGLVLTYSTSRIFNFGHAATAFASAYLYFQLHGALGWNGWLTAALVALVFAPLMGYLWNRVVFSKLGDAEDTVKIVASVGVLIVVPAITILACDLIEALFQPGFQDISEVLQAPGLLPVQSHTLARGLVVSNDQLAALGAAVILFGGLWVLLRFSRLGLQMRVMVDSADLARLRGIRHGMITNLSWVISFALAAVAGILAVPFAGPFGLVSDNYTIALFVATAAVVIARLRSVPVAFVAALGLGAARNIVVAYVNEQHLGAFGAWAQKVYGLTSALPYFVLLAALIFFGHERRKRKAGTAARALPPRPDYRDDLGLRQKATPWIVKGAIVLVPGLFLADTLWRQLIIYGFALGIVFLSYTIVTGLGGMVSLAQGVFVTAAAVTAGLLFARGWPFLLATLAGIVVAALLGMLTATPALRLSGLMLTISTLAVALLAESVLFKVTAINNNGLGWSIPRPFGLTDDRLFLIFVFACALLMAKLVGNLTNSAAGRAMMAIRTTEPAAAASGVAPAAVKLTIFALSAGMAGFGGILATSVYGTVDAQVYPPQATFLWLAIVVVVGVRRPAAAIEAGIVAAVFPRIISHGFDLGFVSWGGISNALITSALFGLAAIQMASQPDGYLVHLEAHARARRDRRRAQRRSTPASRPAVQLGQPSGAATQPGNGAETSALPSDSRSATVAVPMDDRADDLVPITGGSLAGPGRVDAGGARASGDALLEIRGLRAGYGELEVLHGVDLRVPRASILGLLGANGSGKSTLCATVAGLVPTAGGEILFDGEDIGALGPAGRVSRGLVLVPESRGVFPSVTVDDNLRVWLRDKKERETAYELFPRLSDRRRQPAGNLSGGEQQMLSLAPFLVRRPKLLISDEPSLGLAQVIVREIFQAFEELKSSGTTIVLVEEKARDVLTIADQIGVLRRGELAWLTDRSDVDADRIATAYLGAAPIT